MRNFLFLFFLIVPITSFGGQNSTNSNDAQEAFYRAIHADYLKIKSFGWIMVSFEGDDAKKIGLDDKELTDFARLKFKNNFAGIQFTDRSKDLLEIFKDEKQKSTIGSINIRVWIVGDNFPIAYHIEIKAGGISQPSYLNAVLGYGSKQNVPDTVKTTIEKFIEGFAIDFFKVRKEL